MTDLPTTTDERLAVARRRFESAHRVDVTALLNSTAGSVYYQHGSDGTPSKNDGIIAAEGVQLLIRRWRDIESRIVTGRSANAVGLPKPYVRSAKQIDAFIFALHAEARAQDYLATDYGRTIGERGDSQANHDRCRRRADDCRAQIRALEWVRHPTKVRAIDDLIAEHPQPPPSTR